MTTKRNDPHGYVPSSWKLLYVTLKGIASKDIDLEEINEKGDDLDKWRLSNILDEVYNEASCTKPADDHPLFGDGEVDPFGSLLENPFEGSSKRSAALDCLGNAARRIALMYAKASKRACGIESFNIFRAITQECRDVEEIVNFYRRRDFEGLFAGFNGKLLHADSGIPQDRMVDPQKFSDLLFKPDYSSFEERYIISTEEGEVPLSGPMKLTFVKMHGMSAYAFVIATSWAKFVKYDWKEYACVSPSAWVSQYRNDGSDIPKIESSKKDELKDLLQRPVYEDIISDEALSAQSVRPYTCREMEIRSRIASVTKDRTETLSRLLKTVTDECNYLLLNRKDLSNSFYDKEYATEVQADFIGRYSTRLYVNKELDAAFDGPSGKSPSELLSLFEFSDWRFNLEDKPVIYNELVLDIIDSCIRIDLSVKQYLKEALEDDAPSPVPSETNTKEKKQRAIERAINSGLINSDACLTAPKARLAIFLVEQGFVPHKGGWKWSSILDREGVGGSNYKDLARNLSWNYYNNVFKERSGKPIPYTALQKAFDNTQEKRMESLKKMSKTIEENKEIKQNAKNPSLCSRSSTAMDKYLFIDFDGVLNTGSWHENLDAKGLKHSDSNGEVFDPRAVGWLEKIIEQTGAKVFVISSWISAGDAAIAKLWRDRKMPGERIRWPFSGDPFETPPDEGFLEADDPAEYALTHSVSMGKSRLINRFFDEVVHRKPQDCRYAILDDVDSFKGTPHHSHFIQIEDFYGITPAIAEKAIALLNEKG